MILLADCGTTKCDWIFVDSKQHNRHFEINTSGFNPVYHTENEIIGIINNSNDILSIKSHVETIYFFGSGCGTKEIQNKMKDILHKAFFTAQDIHVSSDIEGAVYACTQEAGVVAILGTGSNSAYFDGKRIERRVPSLGYSLMDDGGGNSIGRACLRAYYFKQMPEHLRKKMESEFDLDVEAVKRELYKEHRPSQYLASFAPFVFENLGERYMAGIVKSQVTSFFNTSLSFYKDELKDVPVHFVGTIAHHARDIIKELCDITGYKLGKIVERPVIEIAENLDEISGYFS